MSFHDQLMVAFELTKHLQTKKDTPSQLVAKPIVCNDDSKVIPVNIFARYHGDRCKFKT